MVGIAFRLHIESLLAGHEAAGSFLEPVDLQRPEAELPPGTESGGSSPPAPQFEHYRILRILGEGGMGIVYEAEQEHPRRRVALKVVHAACMSINLLQTATICLT